MAGEAGSVPGSGYARTRGLIAWWHRTPLYLRIIGGVALGVLTGVVLGEKAAVLELPSHVILRLLGALAPMLILVAVIRALMTAEIKGRTTRRLIGLLLVNTTVAIVIGLSVANVLRPGAGGDLKPPGEKPLRSDDPLAPRVVAIMEAQGFPREVERPEGPMDAFLANIPRSLLGPLGDGGNVIGVIFIAVAFGIALRRYRQHPIHSVEGVVDLGFHSLLVVLHWVIDLVPVGVFGIVASIVGVKGFTPLLSLGTFIGAVLIALALQGVYYLVRIGAGCWASPLRVIRGTRDALVMAFSTSSSTVTMPVTYECLREKVGLREESAGMGALVGANFNNDGTALYEAMAALFIAQMLGLNLTLTQQLIVVLTSIVASVGAAGIPEAGLVTMTMVFSAAGLPPVFITLLLPIDWFLDRCRTMVNVMGDITVSCLLDGKVPPPTPPPPDPEVVAAVGSEATPSP